MVDVERERFNEDGFQIEREVECDTNTAVEGGTVISDSDSRQRLWGAPPGWHPPEPPPNWKSKDVKVDKGEPPFAEVDNPGQWIIVFSQVCIFHFTLRLCRRSTPFPLYRRSPLPLPSPFPLSFLL